MFWICIKYHDVNVHHVFRRVGLVYNTYWPNRIHAFGDAICGVSFSDNNDESRSDMVGGIIIGVDANVLQQPMDACEKCQAERVRLAAGGRAVYTDEGGN